MRLIPFRRTQAAEAKEKTDAVPQVWLEESIKAFACVPGRSFFQRIASGLMAQNRSAGKASFA